MADKTRWLLLIRGVGLLVLMLAIGATSAAEAYRWRDAEGSLHFGDRPPAGIAAEKITIRVRHVAAQTAPLSTHDAEREPTDETLTATAPDPAKLDRCAHAQWALSALETARPVYRDEQGMFRIKRPRGHVDAYTGERAYLDDPARAQEIINQKRIIQESCGRQPTAADKARVEKEILAAEHCEAAAAELEDLTRAGRRQDNDLIAARREYLDTYCARR